jgi:hypothetical protein
LERGAKRSKDFISRKRRIKFMNTNGTCKWRRKIRV